MYLHVMVCHSYILVRPVCHLHLLVRYPYVTRRYLYVTRMYSYVIRISLVSTRICMSFVYVFTMNLFNRQDKTSLALDYKDKYKRVEVTLFKKQTDSQNCFQISVFTIKNIAINQAQRMKRMRLRYTKNIYKIF